MKVFELIALLQKVEHQNANVSIVVGELFSEFQLDDVIEATEESVLISFQLRK